MRNKYLFSAAIAAFAILPIAVHASAVQGRDQGAAWRDVATEHDRARVRGWRATWMEGLAAARRQHDADVEREGALLEPDAALLEPAPPPGEYRCRTIKLGAQGGAMLDWVDYPDFRCRIEGAGATLTFTRLGGSQRPIGRIFPDGVRRMVFLGSLQLGDERRVRPYGADPQRDMAAILERIDERRWRLVFPRPAFESIIDVIELVPAT